MSFRRNNYKIVTFVTIPFFPAFNQFYLTYLLLKYSVTKQEVEARAASHEQNAAVFSVVALKYP